MTHRCLPLLLLLPLSAAAANEAFDVVVYGGTAGGVIAAVSAAREGLRTALLEPTGHVGGMVSGGLGYTDIGVKQVIGGFAYEFYFRMGQHYQVHRYSNDVAWYHEPRVAEQIFREMLSGANVKLLEHVRLKEKGGVHMAGGKVVSIDMENGSAFTAAVFIDSSYEGDLMAQSGVTWTSGRESTSQYREPLAGVRERTPFHQFLYDIPAKDAQGRMMPEISPASLPAPGSADKAIQAYNFRNCFTQARNRVVFAKPPGYDPRRYQLFARLLAARTRAEGRDVALTSVLSIGHLPNGATDINNNGAFSTDYIGASWDYPDASYARRDQIWQEHKKYQAGFFYFLAHDPQVPAALRDEMNKWGLCPDEFTDSANWPRQLYIREARRMVGEYVMTQQDLQTNLTKPDAIGMGSYNSDSHNVQRIVDARGFVRNEGDMQVAVKPYQIPYRILLPKRAQATNLLVPVAFSASHVAYSSVRMEPQYMILGQAAGVAAKMAIAGKIPVQDIDTKALAAKLRGQGAVLEYVTYSQETALQQAKKAISSVINGPPQ
jgi:hypothetical protein